MRLTYHRIDSRQWTLMIVALTTIVSTITLWYANYEDNQTNLLNSMDEIISKEEVIIDVSNQQLEAINDNLAAIQEFHVAVDTNAYTLQNLIYEDHLNLVDNITHFETLVMQNFQASYNNYSASFYQLYTAQIASNNQLKTIGDNIHTIKDKQAEMYNRQGTIETNVKEIKDILVTIRDVQKEIRDFLISPEFAGFVLKTLNEHVQTFSADLITTVDTTLDFCEYDPLGVGPIECEGSEFVRARLTGLKFE